MPKKIWLKNIGASNDRLAAKWYDEGSADGEFKWFVRFSDAFPGTGSIASGDLLLYHAFVQGQEAGRLVGVARVGSDQPLSQPRGSGDQWPWVRHVTPLLIVPLAGHGPTLAELGIETPPMGGYKEIGLPLLKAAVERLAANSLPPD